MCGILRCAETEGVYHGQSLRKDWNLENIGQFGADVLGNKLNFSPAFLFSPAQYLKNLKLMFKKINVEQTM